MTDGLHSVLSFLFDFHVLSGKVRGGIEENYSCFIFAFYVSARFMGGRGDGTESTNHSDSGMCSNPLVASSYYTRLPICKEEA